MTDNAEPPWLVRARSDLRKSTREVPGPEASPFILDLYRTLRITETSDEPAWCSVYACATLVRSGVKCWRRMRAARGALEWGHSVAFRPGAIGVKRRLIDGVDDGKHGHVFFGVSIDGDVVRGLGGNQTNRVSIAEFRLSDMIDWRWPNPSDIKVFS